MSFRLSKLADNIYLGRFPFSQNIRISGSVVNGTLFVGSSYRKIPRKSGKSKKVTERERNFLFHLYVSRSLYQFQVHGWALRRTGVYDQMEHLFTNRKFHFCSHLNFRVFFLNGKRPLFTKRNEKRAWSQVTSFWDNLCIFCIEFAIYFSKIFKDLCTENWGKLPRKI